MVKLSEPPPKEISQAPTDGEAANEFPHAFVTKAVAIDIVEGCPNSGVFPNCDPVSTINGGTVTFISHGVIDIDNLFHIIPIDKNTTIKLEKDIEQTGNNVKGRIFDYPSDNNIYLDNLIFKESNISDIVYGDYSNFSLDGVYYGDVLEKEIELLIRNSGIHADLLDEMKHIFLAILNAGRNNDPSFTARLSNISKFVEEQTRLDNLSPADTSVAVAVLAPIPRSWSEAKAQVPGLMRWSSAKRTNPSIVEHLRNEETGFGRWTRNEPGLPRAALLLIDGRAHRELSDFLKIEGNSLPDDVKIPMHSEVVAQQRDSLEPEQVRWARRTLRKHERGKARALEGALVTPIDPEDLRKARLIVSRIRSGKQSR